MKTIYLDAVGSKKKGAIGVFVQDTRVVWTGTTVYSMSVKEKNDEYRRYADEYDIHFIFDDEIPVIDFYTVPRVDILALDSEGGFIGTVGQESDLQSDAPICYINRDRECFLIAENGQEFLKCAASWKKNKKPYDGITFYRSREEAQKEREILLIPDIKFEKPAEDLMLIKPDISYREEIASYRQEFLDSGDSMDGCGALRRLSAPEEWLKDNLLMEKEETLPDSRRVTATQFVCVRGKDRRIVGMIQVRHYFNEYLEKYAGHIGYSVRPSERRRGYARWMLQEVLPFCGKLGLDRVLVTCQEENEGSRRTILANGGVYESTVFEPEEKMRLQRYWISLNGK